MKRLLLLFFVISSINTLLQAQQGRTCGSMDALSQALASDPTLQAKRQFIEQHTQQFVAANKKTRTLVTIPVVFHVVYNTAAQNIPDSLILAQLEQLNLDYAHLNSDSNNTPAAFKPLAANTQIQFCLAVRDPNGNPTTGITRTSTTQTSFSTNNGVKSSTTGGVNPWNTSKYLNIWICNLGSSLLGYAQFPGGSAATDGVVVLYTSVGSMNTPNPNGGVYNIGRTATHEVGHWLNLYHIWGDDGSACTGTDQVNDTPNQGSNNYGCPTYPLTDACATAAPGVMFMNYMDYVDDGCMNMFTAGQSSRMAALFSTGGSRVSLLSSDGCIPVIVAPCTAAPNVGNILSSADTFCNAGSATLSLSNPVTAATSGVVYQWQYSANGISNWTNIGTNSSSTSVSTIPGIQYYRCQATCTNANLTYTTPVKSLYTTGIASVDNDTVCNAGAISLQANGAGTMKWYKDNAGANLLYTGNPFNVTVAGDTIFYVQTGTSTTGSVGPVDYTIGTSSNFNTFTNGQFFRTYQNLVIDTVFAFPSSTGNIVVQLLDSASNTLINTATFAVSAANVGQKMALPIAFSCNANSSYKLLATGSTVGGLMRNTAGLAYPYILPGALAIIRSTSTQSPTGRYYFFYDWKVTVGCTSGLVPVNVHVGALNMNVSYTPIACNGGSTAVTLSTGAAGSYNYTLNSSNNNNGTFSNIGAGTYTVSMSSTSSACSSQTTINISQPLALSVATQVSGAGCSTSDLIASASGGNGQFAYSLNGGASNNSGQFTALSAGTYTIQVSDANACSTTSTVTIAQGNSPSVSNTTLTNTTCNGVCDGAINFTSSGGTGTISYAINGNNPQTVGNFVNLCAATYTLIVTDANNCTGSTVVTLTQPQAVNISTQNQNVLCNNTNTASITASGTNGVSPYTYALNAGSFSSVNTFNNLAAGVYTVFVSDANNCSKSTSVNITSPTAINLTTSIINATTTTTGSVTVNTSGGSTPYSYSLNGGTSQSSNFFGNLNVGVYTVVVTDKNGCTASIVVDIRDVTGLSEIEQLANAILVYPNPGSSLVKIEIPEQTNLGQVQIQLYNMLGQTLIKKTFNFNSNARSCEIDISAFANGIYNLELRKDMQLIKTNKLIKQ